LDTPGAFSALRAELENMSLSPVLILVVNGVLLWMGDPSLQQGNLGHRLEKAGAHVVSEVLKYQHMIQRHIEFPMSLNVLLDQTEIANQILGGSPEDTKHCWLVNRGLKTLLLDEQEVIHSVGDTHWWQQPERLDRDTLIYNPVLQRIAMRSVMRTWE
jgi:hypothetical protein